MYCKHDEFVPAYAGDEVCLAESLFQETGRFLQGNVSLAMAKPVIYPLQFINVYIHQQHSFLQSLNYLDLLFGYYAETPAVDEP